MYCYYSSTLSPHCVHTVKTLGWVHIIFDQDTLGDSCAATSSPFSLTIPLLWCDDLLPNSICTDFPGGSDGKVSAYNAGDLGSFPGSGGSLEKEMTTYSNILAWKIPWTEEPGSLYIGEGNDNPLQYSCLENPMDGGAWWAAVHGVAQSRMTERLHFHFSLSCIGEENGTPVFLSGESQGWWSLVGYCL